MTQQIAYLTAVIGADISSFRRGMSEVRRDTGLLSDTMGGISQLGRNMTLAITTPLLIGAGAAVKLAGSFDASMRNINSIAFLSEDALKSLSERTLEFGSSIRSGPQAASEALYTVFSAGITDVDKAFTVMTIGAKTAEAGLADLTTTTEGLTAAALTFGDQSDKALQNFSDAATLAVQLGVGSMDTFNTGMANVIGTGAALGDTYQDLAATTAFLSQRGVDFASAGTYLNNALTKMLKPGEELDALFHKMGVKSGKELIDTTGGFTEALRAMYDVVGSDETVWAKLFPDARGFKAVSRIFTMFEKDGTDAVSTFFDTFNNKMEEGGVTAAAWEQQMMSFSAQFDMLTSALQGFGITIGNILLPILTPIVNKITEFIKGLSQANPELLKLGVAILSVVAAAGPLLWILGSLITPIGLIAGAVVGLALVFATNFGGIRDTLTTEVAKITGSLQPLIDGIKTFFDTLTGTQPEPIKPETVIDTTQWNTFMGGAGTDAGTAFHASVDKTMSAWDLFTSSGLDKQMSWKEFQNVLKEQGWEGGALTAGMNFKFFDTDALNKQMGEELTTAFDPSKSMNLGADWYKNFAPPTPEADTSFGGRLSAAIAAAWPKVQTALNDMWTNFQTWVTGTALPAVDTWGSDALDKVAGWFSPKGSTGQGNGPVYDALQNLLSGDIGKAAASVGDWFTKTFPQVSKSLTTFFGQVGDWIVNEGIPTIARGIGYLGGKVAVLFNSAISSAFSFISGQGGGPSAGGVAKGVQDKVLTPMSAGFQDALKDSGIDPNTANSFFTNLEGILIAGAMAWTIAPTFATNVISKIATSLVTKLGITKAFEAVGTALSGAIFGKTTLKVVETATGEYMMQPIKTGLIPAISTAFSGAWTAATASLGTLSIVGLALAATVGALVMIFDENARRQVNEAVGGLIDSAFGQGSYEQLNKSAEQGAYRLVGGFYAAMAQVAPTPEQKAEWEGKAKTLFEWSGDITVTPASITVDTTNTKPPTDDWAKMWLESRTPSDIEAKIGSQEFNVNAGGGAAAYMQKLTDDLNAATIPPEALTTFATNMQGGINGALASGNYNGQDIVDTLIVPLANGFATNFGADSAAALAWAGFITAVEIGQQTVDDKFILISQDILLLSTDAVNNMPTFTSAVAGSMRAITLSIHDADFAAKNLSATLQALNGSTVTFTTQVVGGTPVPNKASGGSIFGGMSVVGERGPELINMGANKGTVLPTRVLKTAMAGSGQSSGGNVINVYGVSDVDSFLFELERRGYPVNK